MKNRTIIGIVCMILAVAMTFTVAPLVNRLTSDTTTVVRLKQDVGRGAKITAEQVETVKVKKDTMPQGMYYEKNTKEELETALSIITTSYVRSDDIVAAVRENIKYIKPPPRDVFKSFEGEATAISSNIKRSLYKLKAPPRNYGKANRRWETLTNSVESPRPCSRRAHKVRLPGSACQP